MTRTALALLFALVVAALSGCHMNRTQKGALAGTAVGAVAGTVIGHQSGNDVVGGVVGAATGAVAGGLMGNAADANAEREDAVKTANHTVELHENWEHALRSTEILDMVKADIQDQLILEMIQDRGTRFDPTPENIVYLKKEGVSEPVIRAMQRHSVPFPPSRPNSDIQLN